MAKEPTKKQLNHENTEFLGRMIRYSIGAIIVLVPLVFSPEFSAVFTIPKLIALRFFTATTIFFWAWKIFIEKKIILKTGWFPILILISAIWYTIATFTSITPFTSFFGTMGRNLGLITILSLHILALAAYNFFEKKHQIRVISLSFFVATLLTLYSLGQACGLFQDGFRWSQDPADRVFATLGHGNHLGAYLGMHLMFGFFLWTHWRKVWQRIILLLALILQASVIVLTGSRAALMATLFVLIFLGVGAFFTSKVSKIQKLIVVLSVMGVLFLGLSQWRSVEKIPLIERSQVTFENWKNGIIPDRFSWWLSSVEMIKEKPIFGWGVSTFRDAYNLFRRTDYFIPKQEPDGAENMHELITPEAAHNEFINIAVNQGVPGIIIFLFLIIQIFFSKSKPQNKIMTTSFKAAIAVYLLQSSFNFWVISTIPFFYLFASFASENSQKNNFDYPIKTIRKYLGVSFLILCSIVLIIMTYHEAEANRAQQLAKRLIVQGQISDAINQYEHVIQNQPFEYEYFQNYADDLLKIAKKTDSPQEKEHYLTKAQDLYTKSENINPYHPSTWYNHGLAELDLFILTKNNQYLRIAEQKFDKSIKTAVNNPLYPYQVAKAYLAILKTNFVNQPEIKENIRNALNIALEIRNAYRDSLELLNSQIVQ